MKRIFAFVLLFLFAFSIKGQFKIKGIVISKDKKPIEFATVSIYPLSDSTNIQGVTTNSLGTFQFFKLRSDQYKVVIQLLGFQDRKFVRNHKSFVVSINVIEKIDGNRIEIGGQKIPSGRTYKDQLLGRLKMSQYFSIKSILKHQFGCPHLSIQTFFSLFACIFSSHNISLRTNFTLS